MPMAEWLDFFQRDLHPEPEVIWWERLAQCCVEYTRKHELQGAEAPVRLRFQTDKTAEESWHFN